MRKYLLRVLIALDQCAQASSNRGMCGVTISTRAFTAREHGHLWGIWLANALDRIEKDHCRKSLEGDRRRAQAVLDDLRQYG